MRAGEVGRNVAELAEWPRYRRPRVRPWQPAAFAAFLDQIDRERLAPLFHLAGHAGLRRGELCGLRWQDLDLDARVLVVRQQVVQVGHRVVVGKPKTASGEDRPVDLDAGTVGVLRGWRRRQAAERLRAGPAWRDSGLVFTRPDGSGWHPQQVTKRFRQLATAAGLPGCRLHDLRHLSASLQLAAGVDIAVVSKRLGHSALSFTCDTYCHLIGKAGRQAADKTAVLVARSRTSNGAVPSICLACGHPLEVDDGRGGQKPLVRGVAPPGTRTPNPLIKSGIIYSTVLGSAIKYPSLLVGPSLHWRRCSAVPACAGQCRSRWTHHGRTSPSPMPGHSSPRNLSGQDGHMTQDLEERGLANAVPELFPMCS
jgi:Phage integrase family